MNDLSYKFLYKFLDDILSSNEAFTELISNDVSKKYQDSFLNRMSSFKEIEDKLIKVDDELSNYYNQKTINLIKKHHEGN